VIEHAAPAPAMPPAPAPTEKPKLIEKGKAEAAAPATIIVSLPADARLTVDGVVTTSTSTRRVFESPVLEVGKAYSYTLNAEINQDGTTVVVTKNVTISAGATVNVTLSATDAAVASR
jgi:uncharacterized protein (TIGR03000 family)